MIILKRVSDISNAGGRLKMSLLIFLAFTFSGPYIFLNTFVLLQNNVLCIINVPVENVAVRDQAMQFAKVTDFPVIVCYIFENTAI